MTYWTPLHSKLHQTLRCGRSLLPPGAKILVAVSGGQDSLCLGKLLLDLSSKWNWQIAIAHCDHQWSTDVGIAERVSSVARSWQLPYYLKVANMLDETEAAARKWRYQALVEIAREREFPYIVTGHTKSDRAETFLYNLIRGAGADGLAALSWKRLLTDEIALVRPILNIYRYETLEFCQQFDLPIWHDVVNENNKYARNRIRKDLIPYLQDNFNPQVENSLAQTAELLKADVEYLEEKAQQLLQTARSSNKLNRSELRNAPLAIQRRAIRQFLPLVMSKQPNFGQIEAVVGLVTAPNKSRTSSLPGGAIAEVAGEWIVFKNLSGE
ncbi:tRNA lysidine(34) synthetase TilS [Waterburya agarophytonicola K14]|uniref:tRNA(Ile)-lysidine synthase n=1 Tax=Waterburya agarophytonicola KI4 TaxID=2874699 RepID=A0A964BT11_9CYAN|nr:tRNA lysidine(34) synthetase TilS [Waterburya agarophytonicola]MCC0178614.1 tRNA lysidine(34) synthetase TilS [Waterburya agarophytonicola KI4]